MNARIPSPAPRPYTTADVFHLIEIGIVDPDARVELVDGALIPMSPKGRQHEIMRERIAFWLKEQWSRAFNMLQEHTLILEDGLMLEPDFILYPAQRRLADAPLKGADLKLVIEVSDTSIDYDLKTKAPLYARHGVEEYWVIDAVRNVIHVHRGGSPEGWRSVARVGTGERLSPLCAPEAAFGADD